ncbi:MAG: hypothetical protein HY928_03820 [Elusimicrobia bacterium]|nr:hypothetical protein [Elusimicrobiota bacterium]
MRGALLACVFAATPSGAAPFEASGSLKTLYSFSRSPLNGRQQWLDLSRARLALKGERTGAGDAPAWALRASAEYDHEVRAGSQLRSPESRLFGLSEPAGILTMEQTISSGTDAGWRHRLYRGWVEAAAGGWSARFGRQRVAWGTGKIWSPVDVLNPYRPTDLEREERFGVDALVVRRGLGTVGGAEAVYGLGESWVETDLLARARTNAAGADLALMGGKVAGSTGAWMAGGETAWDLFEGNLHGEWTYTALETRTPFWRAMAGYEYSFSSDPPWRCLKDLWLNAEFFHNGRGRRDARRYDRGLLRGGREVALAKSYLGLSLKKEFHPLLNAELSLLQNLDDASRFIVPSVSWNPWGELHLSAGWQAFAGARQSEYGPLSNTAFAQAQWFF